MPTRNISLTPEQDAFIEKAVGAGVYQNASEAVRDALRALQQRRQEDALKLATLRMQIAEGQAALDHGDVTELDEKHLEGFLKRLTVTRRRRKR